jgi:hypothetical protein
VPHDHHEFHGHISFVLVLTEPYPVAAKRGICLSLIRRTKAFEIDNDLRICFSAEYLWFPGGSLRAQAFFLRLSHSTASSMDRPLSWRHYS